MCGITGGWWKHPSAEYESRIDNALKRMRRRGPDDRGIRLHEGDFGCVGLGHARLSIIDLTSGGHQPMSSADGRFSLVFNGEIYNYRELRHELRSLGYSFRSESDTEVLLMAWAHWGQACLTKLDGMFAFVMLDKETRRLTCVRDPFGIKPLFYKVQRDSFVFASDISGIQAVTAEKGDLNWQQTYNYLVYGHYDCGPQSFLSDVLSLLPGYKIELDLVTGEAGEPKRWWAPSIHERTDLSFEASAEMIRTRFLDSVRLQLRSDVPVGAALSGGIDSSAVVCAIRHLEPDMPINTFSYIASGHAFSEEHWVDRINSYVDATPHKTRVNSSELANDLDEMIIAQGEPFGSTSIYAQYRVFELARANGVTVTLDGQGADEMLGGYIGFPGQRIHSLLETYKVRDAWNFLNSWSTWPGRSHLLGMKWTMAQMAPNAIYQQLRKLEGRVQKNPSWLDESVLRDAGVQCRYPDIQKSDGEAGRRLAGELARQLTSQGLPSLLRHGDRNSMKFSVESRVPFLTLPLVELMLSLPENYLVSSNGETKHVFREAMRGIVPDEVLFRRDKIGFATPEKDWMIGMQGTIREWLSVDMGLPFFRSAEVLKELDLILDGQKPYTWQVWRWVNFARWHACFLG